MLVSYKWLKEYLEEKSEKSKVNSIYDVISVLNERAFEVESVEKKGDDYLLDVDVLPNRAHDCLCHTGIAKEIAVALGYKFQYPPLRQGYEGQANPKLQKADFETEFTAEISDKRCLRYMLREIRNVKVGESHPDLKNKLEVLGEKSINNIVDITNIVLFELGQPMHAFDKNKLDGKNISARNSKVGESLITLDNHLIELDDDTCVIADTEPLAIAGIKGGKKAEVDNNTKNLILESANFSSTETRKTSNKINIATESSKRYENGITPELTEVAMNRATELLIKYGGSNVEVSNVIDVYPRPGSPYYTGVSVKEVNKLLNTELSENEIGEIFERLGFKYEYLNTKEFVLEEIKKQLGKPHNIFPSLTYDAPNSFDCTTLIAYVYSHGGKSLPRLTIDQLFYGKEITKEGLEPGDLIFSNSGKGEIRYDTINFLPGLKFEEGVDHVGMYLGGDTIIHTSRTKGQVVEEKLSESDNFKKIVGCRRIVDKDEMRFSIRVPNLRLDLRNEADIIEEIGRIYGYENIKPEPVKGLTPVRNSNKEASSILKIKSELQKLGFSEVQTYSFGEKGDLKAIKALSSEKKYLRTTLETGMNEAMNLGHYNADFIGIDKVQIFEIGKIYPKGSEILVLGIGVRNKNSKKPKAGEILQATVDKISEELGVRGQELEIKDEQEFVQIELTDLIEKINTAEEIEINFDYSAQVKPLSQYPFMTRDISVWIPNGGGDENTIFEIVEKHASGLLKTKRLFDVFEKEGRTSYAARVVFQSNEKTLTDDEVGKIMEKVYEELKAKEGFEIR